MGIEADELFALKDGLINSEIGPEDLFGPDSDMTKPAIGDRAPLERTISIAAMHIMGANNTLNGVYQTSDIQPELYPDVQDFSTLPKTPESADDRLFSATLVLLCLRDVRDRIRKLEVGENENDRFHLITALKAEEWLSQLASSVDEDTSDHLRSMGEAHRELGVDLKTAAIVEELMPENRHDLAESLPSPESIIKEATRVPEHIRKIIKNWYESEHDTFSLVRLALGDIKESTLLENSQSLVGRMLPNEAPYRVARALGPDEMHQIFDWIGVDLEGELKTDDDGKFEYERIPGEIKPGISPERVHHKVDILIHYLSHLIRRPNSGPIKGGLTFEQNKTAKHILSNLEEKKESGDTSTPFAGVGLDLDRAIYAFKGLFRIRPNHPIAQAIMQVDGVMEQYHDARNMVVVARVSPHRDEFAAGDDFRTAVRKLRYASWQLQELVDHYESRSFREPSALSL
jgi:hypothetical protein